MKKYIFTAVAAVAMGAMYTSCSHDDFYDPADAKQSIIDTYAEAFIEAFGQPAPTQDWGFGTSAAQARTRTIAVNGDAYDKFPSADDIAANFPTAIPADAIEVSELDNFVNTNLKDADGNEVDNGYGGPITLYNLEWVYQYMVPEGANLKITQPGTYDVGYYKNHGWEDGQDVYHYFNVYVQTEGEVIINRPGDSHFNLYILDGDVKVGPTQYSEWSTEVISVAEGATFTDYRDHIAANGGVSLFNKGTVYATNEEKYDIGNFCKVYNEGKFIITGAMTYSPGDANDSYFMNLGDDAELTAPSMTLNSTGNFFNSGKVTISGETYVTQARLYWVNAGYYKTGSMTFSAKNTTFFNYCQLIVEGNAHMFDGEFNLMQNSYTEAGTAELDNFIVNMGSNTGINIKGDIRMVAQGDATYQGFRTDGSNDYLLIGGKVTVDAHYHTFSISTGITYSINDIEIVRDGNVITEEYLEQNGDGAYPVLDFNGTECPYGQLTVTPNTNSCGATWHNGPTPPTPTADIRVIAEDLTLTPNRPVGQPGNTDFDFNDVVFDVTWISDNEATITLQAAGGTLPLTVGLADPDDTNYINYEVHEKFGVATNVMVNTGWRNGESKDPVSYNVSGNFARNAKNIPVFVRKSGQWIELFANEGQPASKIGVDPDFEWCDERTDINEQYPAFSSWVENQTPLRWWTPDAQAQTEQ